MINPPYSQGSKSNLDLYEINFVSHLLDSLTEGGRCIAIIPQSSMTGKTKEEQSIKANIFKNHTLEGVITLNKDTFYGVGVMPCIALFTAGEPHPQDKECKFIDFRNDGYKVSPHIGLIETEQAKDKKQHLLDVWFDRLEAETKFCVNTIVEVDDEWLHSFYYFNDEIPTDEDFEKSIGDYLTFEFSMIMNNREYLFDNTNENKEFKHKKIEYIENKEWGEFFIGGENGLFNISSTSSGIDKNKLILSDKKEMPYITRTDINNGINLFIQDNQLAKYKKNEGNVITIGLDTQTVFYQAYNFFTGQNIQVMKHDFLNKYNALFLIPLIKIQMEKFNWGGNGATLGRLARTKIMLPVNEKKEPDFEYMEQYMKNLTYKKINQYLNYYKRYM